MSVTVGDTATAEQIRARWAYGELNSDRFKAKFRSHQISKHILNHANAGDPFDSVGQSFWQELDQLLDKGRPGEFHSWVRQYPQYRCVGWSKSDLLATLAIRAFNIPHKQQPLPYYDFYNGLPNTGPNGLAENSDPRVQAFRTHDRTQVDPATAIRSNGSYLLLEGYFRSILFMRSPDPDLQFLVWIPS